MQQSLDKSVLEIVLDDLETGNAFDRKKAHTLSKFLDLKNISLIVVRSQGRVFCSGGNLKDYAKLKTKAEGVAVNRKIRLALAKLAKHPALKVAYVSGDCFGGGIELLSSFDLIYSEPHVFYGMWQRKMSLSFGWGGFERLSRRMNPAMAQEWLLMSDVRTAYWAEKAGLVDSVMSGRDMRTHRSRLMLNCQNDKDGTFKAISLKLKKNEVKVFDDLWGSKAHLEQLKKFGQPKR